jgi:hypothetical protein
MSDEKSLAVTVERVPYPPAHVENQDWFILVCRDGPNEVVAKGKMGWRPQPKERLKLFGKWSTYQGKREFKFDSAALDIPTDARGMLHYVCELASGVGAALEQQIWDLKGEDWATIEEGELPRFKGKVFSNFADAVSRAEADRTKGAAIAQLLAAGASMNMAAAAWEQWQQDTLGVVASNPYRLAELPNYGFADVDNRIRQHYGIGDSDMRRIRAAVVYVLRQITSGGSTVVNWDVLNKSCLEKLGGYQELITQAVREMFGEGTLKGFQRSRGISLASDFRNEQTIWNFINTPADQTPVINPLR